MMISDAIQAKLNDQITAELSAAHSYLAMACAFEQMGLKILAKLFFQQHDDFADHNVTDPFAYVAVATVAGDVRVERIMAPSTNCDRRHAMQHFATEAIRILGDHLELCD